MNIDEAGSIGGVPRFSVKAVGKSAEVAGLRTHGIRYREGTGFCLIDRGAALGEVWVDGRFALMYRRNDHAGSVQERMFWVTDSDYEVFQMSHAELLEAVNKLADVAE